jgi:hypothetical protein
MRIKGTQILLGYPPVLLASFYGTWLLARLYLGHWPVPNIDDPKFIEGFLWMWIYDLTLILLVSSSVVPCLCAAVSLFRRLIADSPDWRIRTIEAIVGLGLLGVATALIEWDPTNTLEWLFD